MEKKERGALSASEMFYLSPNAQASSDTSLQERGEERLPPVGVRERKSSSLCRVEKRGRACFPRGGKEGSLFSEKSLSSGNRRAREVLPVGEKEGKKRKGGEAIFEKLMARSRPFTEGRDLYGKKREKVIKFWD